MSTKKSYHHGNLRQALIDTSLDVIAELGFRALTLREIGTRLNISRMAPYRHFADKSALLTAIVAAGFAQFTETLEAAITNAGSDFTAQADALAIAYVKFSLEHRAHFEVMFGGGGNPQFLDEEGGKVAYRSFLVLENLVRRGQAGNFVVAGDPTAIAQMVWATVHGISMLRMGPVPEWDLEFAAYCSRLLRSGLLPR